MCGSCCGSDRMSCLDWTPESTLLKMVMEGTDGRGIEGTDVCGLIVVDVWGPEVDGAVVGSSTAGPRKRTSANLFTLLSGVGSPAVKAHT